MSPSLELCVVVNDKVSRARPDESLAGRVNVGQSQG